MVRVAEYLVNALVEAGVQRVYGLPGGENVEVLDELRKRRIDFLLVKNESSACFMAATEACLTGGIGVALTTLGPGAANAYAGIAHCHLDRAPALLITAASDPDLARRHTHQLLDLNAVFRPVCKFSAELSAENAAADIDAALRVVRSNRPGPAHLSLHNRVALQRVAAHATTAPPEPIPPQPNMAAFRRFLEGARKPVIVAGLGLEPERPYAQLRALAESLGSPVILTPKAKGALSADHPLYAGAIGLTRSDPVYALLDEADAIITLGFDVVELVKPWDCPQPLLWIANWANDDPRVNCQLEYIGTISWLLERLGSVEPPTATDWAEGRVRRFRESLAGADLPPAKPRRMLPQTFMRALRENTPDDIIVATDVGSHKIFSALEWQARKPNRYFVSNGLSAMGFGLCGAIAAAEVAEQPAVCVTGDAGLLMVMGELGLLAERRLPVLVAVMNDGALDLIRAAQRRGGKTAFGTDFQNPDFASIAHAFGLPYRVAESEGDCAAAIGDWTKSGGPMLLDVMIDPIGYPTTPRGET